MNSNGIPVLSIRPPWWWAVLYAGKDVENREWASTHRGLVFIHASKWWSGPQVDALMDDVRVMYRQMTSPPPWPTNWTLSGMRSFGGYIVGVAEMTDCVSQSDSPWFMGRYGFVLKRPRTIRPVPCKGRLGFFPAPAEAIEAVNEIEAV